MESVEPIVNYGWIILPYEVVQQAINVYPLPVGLPSQRVCLLCNDRCCVHVAAKMRLVAVFHNGVQTFQLQAHVLPPTPPSAPPAIIPESAEFIPMNDTLAASVNLNPHAVPFRPGAEEGFIGESVTSNAESWLETKDAGVGPSIADNVEVGHGFEDLQSSPRRKRTKRRRKPRSSSFRCGFCYSNGESVKVYSSHPLWQEGIVQCPILRKHVCPTCRATGDNAHTEKYCMERNDTLHVFKTVRDANGKYKILKY